jgi:hypothetical protein
MATAMHYPCNYGYIPQTLADDGDPVDVLVITPVPLIPGVVVTCRPLGMLKMEDEAGGDNKLLAVPIDKILSIYSQWKKPEDLNPMRLKTIQHFFEHYKDLEPASGSRCWAGKARRPRAADQEQRPRPWAGLPARPGPTWLGEAPGHAEFGQQRLVEGQGTVEVRDPDKDVGEHPAVPCSARVDGPSCLKACRPLPQWGVVMHRGGCGKPRKETPVQCACRGPAVQKSRP